MDMEEKILSEICERELNVEEVSSLRDIPTELGITSLSLVYLLVELEKEVSWDYILFVVRLLSNKYRK